MYSYGPIRTFSFCSFHCPSLYFVPSRLDRFRVWCGVGFSTVPFVVDGDDDDDVSLVCSRKLLLLLSLVVAAGGIFEVR